MKLPAVACIQNGIDWKNNSQTSFNNSLHRLWGAASMVWQYATYSCSVC